MNPRVLRLKANDDYTLTLTFTNGEVKLYDVSGLLDFGVFRELKDKAYFKSAAVRFGTVQWPHEQDICPDTLYMDSRNLGSPNYAKGRQRFARGS